MPVHSKAARKVTHSPCSAHCFAQTMPLKLPATQHAASPVHTSKATRPFLTVYSKQSATRNSTERPQGQDPPETLEKQQQGGSELGVKAECPWLSTILPPSSHAQAAITSPATW